MKRSDGTDVPQQMPGRRRARAMTLIELVVALAITSLVLVGVGAAVRLAAGALPGREDALSGLLKGQRFLDEFLDSLAVATAIEGLDLKTVVIRVPDRDKDGAEERLEYVWGGSPGDPVTLSVNGGEGAVVLESCEGLVLSPISADGRVRAVQVALDLGGRAGVLRSGVRLLSFPEAP